MLKKQVHLINTPRGTLWAERGKYYKTLKGAKTAALRDAKNLANYHGAVATIFTIEGF